MIAFKALATRTMAIFLVFGLTVWGTTNAIPIPIVPGDQTTISPRLVDLKMVVTGARNDANHIFSVNCQKMMDPVICTILGKNSQEMPQYPHFVLNQTETLDKMLEDMNEVCVGFQHLLDKWSADVAQQPGLSHLSANLIHLRDVSLGSIRAVIVDMKPDMKIVNPSAEVDTSPDISKRNIRNLLIVAQMTAEMNSMMSAIASNL